MTIPLAYVRDAEVAGHTFTRLLTLDEIWTDAATQLTRNPTRSAPVDLDRTATVRIGRDIMRYLDRVRQSGEAFGAISERFGHDLNDALNRLLWSDDLSPRDREDLRWLVSSHGGIVAMGINVRELADFAQLEKGNIDKQIDQIQAGGVTAGDLSREFRCGAVQGTLVSGVVMLAGAPAAGAGASAAAAATVAIAVGASGGLAGLALIGVSLWWARRHRC